MRLHLVRLATGLLFAVLAAPPIGAQWTPTAGIEVLRGERSTVILRIPSPTVDAAAQQRVAALIAGCADSLRWSSDNVSAIARGASSTAQAAERDVLLVTVIAHPPNDAGCGDPWTATALLGGHGLWMTRDASAAAGSGIAAIGVTQAGRSIDGTGRERLPLTAVTPDGVRPTTTVYARLRLPVREIGPDAERPSAAVRFTIAFDSGSADDVIDVPWESIRDLWQLALIDRVTSEGAIPALPVVDLAAPRDSALLAARQRLASGASAGAAVADVIRRTTAIGVSRADRVWARAQTALALDLVSDEFGVRLITAALLEDEPCFRWGADAPARLREETRRLASPRARCDEAPAWLVAGRAAVLPGLGRPKLHNGRENQRYAFTLVVVGAFALSQWQNQTAKREYRAYLDETVAPGGIGSIGDVPSMFTRAEAARTRATALAVVGIATWILHGAASLSQEKKFGRRLAELSAVSTTPAAPRIGLQPALTLSTDRIGLGLSIQW